MTMKNILNEWKKFTLNEAKRTRGGVDDMLQQYLGVKVPDGWFNLFNRTVGDLTDRPEWYTQLQTPEILEYYQKRVDEIEGEIAICSLSAIAQGRTKTEEEYQEVVSKLEDGLSFGCCGWCT